MSVTGHTLNHNHDYEDGQIRTEVPVGGPLGHSHSIPKTGEWTGVTDGHKHFLPTREPGLEALLERSGGLKGAMAKLAAEPEQEKQR